MSSTRSTIDLIIRGSLVGLTESVAAAKIELDALKQRTDGMKIAGEGAQAALLGLAKGMLAITAVSGVIQVVGGVVAALQQLIPIVLLAPAGLLALGAVVATLKLGFENFFASFKPGSAGDKAFAKLSTNAKAAVLALKGMGPAFHEVQQATQNALFANIAGDLKNIGTIFLPVLRAQLPAVATGFNEMARSVVAALTLKITKFDIVDILTNTATATHNARNALGAFTEGFIGLGAAGSTYLPRVGTAIDGLAQKFQSFVTRITTDGSFETWVGRAVQGFKDLFHIISDVGSIFLSVLRGIAGPQNDVLASVRATTDALAAFLQTANAQSALGALGDALRAVADATRAVLLEALKQLAPIIRDLSPFVVELAQVFGERLVNVLKLVGPLLDGVAKFLSANKGIADAILPVLGFLAARFALLKIGSAVISGLSALKVGLGGLSNVLKVGGFVALAVIADDINRVNLAAAGNDPAKLDLMAHSLNNIVGAGKEIASGDFSGILSQITDQVNQTGDAWTKGQTPVQQWFDKVKNSFDTDFVGALRRGSDAMDGFFAGIRDKVATSFVNDFVNPIRDGVTNVVGFFSGLGTTIGGAIGDLGSIIATKATDIWTGFTGAVTSGFEAVKAFFSQTPHEMGVQIGHGIGDIITAGLNLMTSFGTAISNGVTNVINFVSTVPSLIGAALGTLGSIIGQVATDAWNFFFGAAKTGVDNTVHSAEQAPAQVGSALSNLGSTLLGIATSAWTGFLNFATTTIANAVAEAQALPGQIGGALASLVGVLVNAATSAWNGFINGARTLIDQAIAQARALPGQIVSAIGNLGSLLVNAGRSLIDGLLAGIKAGVQAMYDFVTGIAQGIAERKGPISYDKIVLKPAGLALMAGLLDGIKAGHADVLDFTSTIAGSIDDSMSSGGLIASARTFDARVGTSAAASTSGAQNGAQGAPTYVIPISIGDEVVRTVRGEIDASHREVKRTVTAGSGTTAG